MIVLALTVALVGPYFVDWTSYRADFEREASRILGREVKVLGTASARLLPFPSVTFTDVSVAGVEPGETAMTIETFSMDAELAPFLSGEILIFDMRLVRPSASVEIDVDGGLSWAARPNVPVGASNITLERLTVTEGKIAVRHAGSGRVHELSEINATLSARALSGPWRMDGSMRIDGMRSKVAISTGPLDDAGSMRLRVRAQPERFDVVVEADGDARIEAGRAHYEGAFKVFAESASNRLRGQGGETFSVAGQGEAANVPPAYRVSGAFDLDHQSLAISEFLFETGSAEDPYTAEGSARLDFGVEPRFLVQADGAQVRFEDAMGDGTAGIGLDERVAGLREFMLDMPRPTIPGRVEVKLPAIVAGDTTVRDVHLLAEPSATGWTIASLGATLPGRTTLEAQGTLDIQDRLAFDGKLLLAVGQPSGFAAWISRDVDEAIRRLPAAGFSATVELSDERQLFRDLELVLGSARFRGEIDSATPAGARPSLSLRLDGDALDVEGMTAFASLFVSDSGETRLADSDVSIEIAAGPVLALGLQAETIDTALRLKDGRLEIDRLSIGGLAGANVSATGVVKDLATTPTGNIDASLIAPDLAPLATTLSERFPASRVAEALVRRVDSYPGLLQDAAIQLVASAAPGGNGTSGMAMSATGELGGTSFSLTATSDDTGMALVDAPVTLDLTASNDEAAAIFALAGLPALPIDFAGPAEIDLAFDGVARDGARARASLSGDNMAATFEGTLSSDGESSSIKGSASIETDDLQPWLATAGISLPGMGLQMPVQLGTELDATGDLLVLSGLSGEVAGASVQGDVNAQMRNGLPHLTGALALGRFDLALVAEMAVGAAALSGDGTDWPQAAFASGVATPFSADLDLTINDLALGGVGRANEARMALRLAPDGVFLSDARATLHGGALAGNLDFRNDAGTGLLSGQLQLEGVQPSAVVGDIGIDGLASVTSTFTANGKSLGGIVSSLAGSGTVAVDALVIEGIDPSAFAAILAAADRAGPDIDAAATAVFAPDLIRKDEFRADRADFAFTIANGTLRAPPILLEGEGASLAAELRADLMAGTLGAEATLVYAAGPETLVGSEPAVRLVAEGPPGDIGVLVDTEPLAQFLTQRALELEQQRVEAMQASLLEKQRHRREVRYYVALAETRERVAEEAARLAEEERRASEELRLLNEEAERRAAEEAARDAAEEAERQRLQEEESRIRRAEEAREAEAEAERQRAERERVQEAERVEAEIAERQRAENERLRLEVEALLRAREPALTPDTNTIERNLVSPPETVDVTPFPAPRAAPPAAVASDEAQRPPPAASVFSERNLSIDGLMRAIGADR